MNPAQAATRKVMELQQELASYDGTAPDVKGLLPGFGHSHMLRSITCACVHVILHTIYYIIIIIIYIYIYNTYLKYMYIEHAP